MKTIQSILLYSMAAFLFISCDTNTSNKTVAKKTEATTTVAPKPLAHVKEKADKYFTQDKITIILAEKPDMKSNKMNIQDYIVNGKSFIPFFTSKEKYKKSTGETDLGKPVIEINPYLFLSLLSGNETVRSNPGLADDINFKASELKTIYKEEIANFGAALSE